MEKLYGKWKQLCFQVSLGIRSNYRSLRMLLGNQLLCDLIYLSSMDPHNRSLPQITHCLRPIQKKRHDGNFSNADTSPTPSWTFRMYPTCILFRVKSWPCVTFNACSLFSKRYYRLYAWSTWNHYQTWVVMMAFLWKFFSDFAYMQPFLRLVIEAEIIFVSIIHSVLKRESVIGPWALPQTQNSFVSKSSSNLIEASSSAPYWWFGELWSSV